jgi:glutathione S-transferase
VADVDEEQAGREAEARRRLVAAGAGELPRPPWLVGAQPPAAADLIQFALWRARSEEVGEGDLLAALALLPAARAEVDQFEAAVLFLARARGLSWPQISRAMGLGSAQAAQQRYDRVSGRVDNR